MVLPATGVIHGQTITLDAPLPALEGRRVRVAVEPDDAPANDTVTLAAAWAHWVQGGPQGPIVC
jgi:hypothetical protein